MPNWLSWDFWAKDSQSFNDLALIIAGVIGIPLLAIRTFAANRSARAALEQAKAANQSAAAAFEQAKTAAERHDEQTRADRERRITESFAKAVEQLGSDKLETRLGGIYTLERIARESEREYRSIMETLTAFVRERAPWPPRQAVTNPFVELQSNAGLEAAGESTPAEHPQVQPATDIQAVLTVLGRRDEKARKQDQAVGPWLDLADTDLRGAYLHGAHLQANLHGAHLERANLNEAQLQGAFFPGAHLQGAFLNQAHLERAFLNEAQLQGADLGGAHLERAFLRDAHLERALLPGAHLQGAFLRDAQLQGTDLGGAHLQGALLPGAHLERANLRHAQLEGAFLLGAHLQGADLHGAHLEGADLHGAHLEGADLGKAVGLTQDQLNKASGDDCTRLPNGLTRPAHWPAGSPSAANHNPMSPA